MKGIYLALLALAAPALAQGQTPKPCPYDSARFSWRRPVPGNRLRPLRPDRPGLTESPFTVDAGHLQLEVDGLRRIRRPGSATEPAERTWHVGFAMLKLGLGRRTDAQLELPVFVAQAQRPPGQDWQARTRGPGDLTLRLKHNFLGDDQAGPLALAVVGYARLPTGSGAISDGAVEYGLVLPLNLEVGDTYNLEAQLEADNNHDPDTRQRHWRLMPSVALDRTFGKRLGLLVEGAFPWDSVQRRWQAQLNVAPTFNVTDNFQLDAGTHLALNGRTDREYFVGFTVRR